MGIDIANKIDWSMSQVICLANDFTKYDENAVNQMGRNIKLVRYRKFGAEFLLFEHLNIPKVFSTIENTDLKKKREFTNNSQKTFMQKYDSTETKLLNVCLTIKDYILSLGDDVTENQLKLYVALKKVKNIVCLEIFKSKIIFSFRT